MFMDDSAFDLEETELPRGTVNKSAGSFEVNTGRYGNSRPNTGSSFGRPDDEDGAFGSAGGIGTPSSSRARMLAQQRELQLKKRQAAAQNGGMIRSSVEASPMKKSTDGQFTPAVRQFSAPKAMRDFSADADEQSTEFGKPTRIPAARSKFSDDEDDVRPSRGGGRSSRNDHEDENYQRNGRSKPSRSGKRYDDEDDDEEVLPRSKGAAKPKSSSRSTRRYDDEDDDEEEDDEDYDRRGSASVRKSDKRVDKDRERERRRYDDEDDEPDGRSSRRKDGRPKGSEGRDDRDRRERGNRDRERDRGDRGDRDRERSKNERKERSGRSARDEDEETEDSEIDRWDGAQKGGRKPVTKEKPREAVESEEGPPPTPAPRAQPLNLRDMRAFLTTPVPKACGVVQCYIRRNKSGTNKLFPIYALYLKDGDRFLMASKKRPNNKTSNYLISMGEGDLNRDGGNYLGKLRSNFVGTEFQVFDNGVSPKEIGEGEDNAEEVRKELASVIYAANVLGSRGPRKMQVSIPAVDENDRPVAWRSSARAAASGDDILGRMKDRNFRDLAYLINKPPRWNEQVGAYVLNFNGRVTMASVKNFQLVDPDEQNAVVLQFGRVGKDEFTMDLQWPMSPFQAFAITLSSFDSKIACD